MDIQPTPPSSSMIGKPAPAFSLPDQDGRIHNLSDYRGRFVLLYAYPKDATPGCSAQACGFRDSMAEFQRRGIVVLGLSILNARSKRKFADKFSLNFPLLADEDHKVLEAYGVWREKSMYGRKYMGVSRETFLIGPDGRIAMHWPMAKGSESHAADVLEWLKANLP